MKDDGSFPKYTNSDQKKRGNLLQNTGSIRHLITT